MVRSATAESSDTIGSLWSTHAPVHSPFQFRALELTSRQPTHILIKSCSELSADFTNACTHRPLKFTGLHATLTLRGTWVRGWVAAILNRCITRSMRLRITILDSFWGFLRSIITIELITNPKKIFERCTIYRGTIYNHQIS